MDFITDYRGFKEGDIFTRNFKGIPVFIENLGVKPPIFLGGGGGRWREVSLYTQKRRVKFRYPRYQAAFFHLFISSLMEC